MQLTKLLYLEDFSLVEYTAHVIAVQQENNRYVVLLDATIFYPQGGGQPYDKGIIHNEHGTFLVEEVRFIDGIVKHIGTFQQGTFHPNDTVACTVDAQRRQLHSRFHSAGHVIDMAVNALQLPWIPGKGYHFPDGPYIEYHGNLEGRDKEVLKKTLEEKANEFIRQGIATTISFMDKQAMHTVCRHVPDYLPADKPLRVVMYGDFGVPCGGTHVQNLRDIQPISIRKIKQDGSTIRISYAIAP